MHVSAAMGCFNSQKSDLDLVLVVESITPKKEKLKFMREFVKLNEEAPAKGIGVL